MKISPTLIRSRRWSVTFDEADARDGAVTVRERAAQCCDSPNEPVTIAPPQNDGAATVWERTQSFGSAKPRDRMQRKLLGSAVRC